MIRNIAMLGLMASFLTLGACDELCGGCDADAATDGAAVQLEDGGDACADCLDGCDDAAAMGSGGLAADVAADGTGDAPLACPVSGTDAEGVCGVVDKDNCGMAGDCSVETDAEAQCETQCDEKPAAPSVTD